MSTALFSLGGKTVYVSSVIITLGILACLIMTLYFSKQAGNEDKTPILVFFPLAFVLGVLFGRTISWYFNPMIYGSLWAALSDFTLGSFSVPGVMCGVILAAALTAKLGFCQDRWDVLDCAAPGLCVMLASVSFSAFFNTTMRGKRVVEGRFFQRLPFAWGEENAAGITQYYFADFFISFLLLVLVFFLVKKIFEEADYLNGDTTRMFLVLYGAVLILMESNRRDPLLMNFKLLLFLNKFSAFFNVGQVFAAICFIAIFVHYLKILVKREGFGAKHIIYIVIFVVALFAMGYLGEYRIQRYGMVKTGYIFQTVACITVCVENYLLYRLSAEE